MLEGLSRRRSSKVTKQPALQILLYNSIQHLHYHARPPHCCTWHYVCVPRERIYNICLSTICARVLPYRGIINSRVNNIEFSASMSNLTRHWRFFSLSRKKLKYSTMSKTCRLAAAFSWRIYYHPDDTCARECRVTISLSLSDASLTRGFKSCVCVSRWGLFFTRKH